MSDILLLGPGKSRRRIHGGPEFGTVPSERLWVVDYDQNVLDYWLTLGAGVQKMNLVRPPFTFPAFPRCAEIHAYEVINLLPGSDEDFFAFWRSMWDILLPGGEFHATVPHWRSRWIHAYPRPQRVYTMELLAHLARTTTLYAQETFAALWPEPYNFSVREAYDVGHQEGEPHGFFFTLRKEGR